jgi:dienelactone hydrolase
MTTILLFHPVLGLTDGVRDVAESLRKQGHEVHTPDLFEGQIFPDIDSGFAYVESIGFPELYRRAEQACAGLPRDVVLGGFSLGVMAAQYLLHTRHGARGALFFHSFIAPGYLPGQWPGDVPVHVFAMDHDPFFVDEGDLAAALTWQENHENLHIHQYPGNGHLFLDATTPDFDPDTALHVVQDVEAALAGMS